MPAPMNVAAAGQTDASGNLTIKQIVQAAYWSMVYFTGQCTGSAAWVMGEETTSIFFQQGSNVVLGPLFLAPGQKASIQVVGATPNTAVTGIFWGFRGQAPDGSDLVGLASSIESTGSLATITGPITIGSGTVGISGNVPVLNASGTQLSTIQPIRTIGTVTAPANTQTSGTFALQSGDVVVGYLVDANAGNANPITVQLKGAGSNVIFLNDSSPRSGIHAAIIAESIDTSVTVTVTPQVATGAKVYVLAISAAMASLLAPQLEAMVPVTFSDTLSGFVAQNAPWQAPIKSALFDTSLNNSAAQVVNGIAGKQIFVHSWHACFSAVAAATVHLESDDNAFPTPGSVGWADWNNVGTVGPFSGSGVGVPGPVGAGVRIANTFAVATVIRGGITYSTT